MNDELQHKYRPTTLAEVIGQPQAVSVLSDFFAKKKLPHTILFTGPSGCLRGDTPIYDPMDGSTRTVADRSMREGGFHVVAETRTGVRAVPALTPVRYDPTTIYRVVTTAGDFYVTGGHRFRVENGYASVSVLKRRLACGRQPQASVGIRLPSISEHALLIRAGGGQRSSRTPEGSLGGYPFSSRSCGGPLHPVSENDREPSQPPTDAHGRSLFWHTDDVDSGPKRSRQRLSFYHPSTPDSTYLATISMPSSSSFGGNATRPFFHTPETRQFAGHVRPQGTAYELLDPLKGGSFDSRETNPVSVDTRPLAFESPVLFHWPQTTRASILSIEEWGQEEYYDFHVPVYNNYWAGGVFHHNCGKTTLARVCTAELGCGAIDFREVNAADARGVDMARDLGASMRRAPASGPVRVFLIDEVHQLPTATQSVMLKMLEEPPAHVYFFLCTTDPAKLLPTVKTRCTEVKLGAVDYTDLKAYVGRLAKKENARVGSTVCEKIAEAADGSVRKAVVLLNQVMGLKGEEAQIDAVKKGTSEAQTIDLAKLLLWGRKNWDAVRRCVQAIGDDPESIRRGVLGYCGAVCLNTAGTKAARAAFVLSKFQYNFFDTGKAGLTLACYEVVHG